MRDYFYWKAYLLCTKNPWKCREIYRRFRKQFISGHAVASELDIGVSQTVLDICMTSKQLWRCRANIKQESRQKRSATWRLKCLSRVCTKATQLYIQYWKDSSLKCVEWKVKPYVLTHSFTGIQCWNSAFCNVWRVIDIVHIATVPPQNVLTEMCVLLMKLLQINDINLWPVR